jgi:hypothetical protein
MNVKMGSVPVPVPTQLLFWEYLFRIFGIGSLQCGFFSQCAYFHWSSSPNALNFTWRKCAEFS